MLSQHDFADYGYCCFFGELDPSERSIDRKNERIGWSFSKLNNVTRSTPFLNVNGNFLMSKTSQNNFFPIIFVRNI